MEMVKVICVLLIAIAVAPSRTSAAGCLSDSTTSAKALRIVVASGLTGGKCATRLCWPTAETITDPAIRIAPAMP